MLSRRNLLAASALAAAPRLAAAQEAGPPAGVVRVPIEVTRNQLWTAVQLQASGPYRFTIDTGAAYFSVQARLAVEAKLHAAGHRTRLITHVGGGQQDYWDSYYADTTVIGGALEQKNLVYQAEPGQGGFIQGVVPGAILLTTPTVIDFADRAIDLYMKGKPDTSGYDRLTMTPIEAANLEIIRQLDGSQSALVIDVEWNGAALKVQVRTAASPGLFLYAHAVDRLQAWDAYPKWAAENGRWGLSTTYWNKLMHLPFKARAVRAGPLIIGSAVIADPVVVMVDPTEVDHVDDGQRKPVWQVGNRRLEVDGYIGMETLRRFSLIVDADQRALWMKPNAAIRQPFRYNRSGLRFKAVEGEITVTGVAPHSPAETAGVQAGDVVLARDGTRPPDNFGWDLSDGPGTVMEFDVQRGGARQPIRMVLREMI